MRMTNTSNRQIIVSRRMLFTWFMLAGLIFYFAPDNWTNKFQFAFAHIFCRPLGLGRNLLLSASVQQTSTDLIGRNEYNKLQNHLANMTALLNQEHQKVEKLSGLRDRLVWKGAKFVLADVIAASISSSHGRLIINRGKDDGLAKGQFVLSDYGVIGTVSEVGSRTARVKLISDPSSKIAVKIAKGSYLARYRTKEGGSGARVIMQGSGNNSAKIRLLPAKHKIKVGYVVYAQKKPGFLDAPMVVGTVDRCSRDAENPLLWDIRVKPGCNMKGLSEVSVIIMNSQE